MCAADLEDLKEEISTELLLGKENGEAELETMARFVWAERQKYLTLTISERLQQFFKAALEAVEQPVNPPVGQERRAASDKGKLLRWKTSSRLFGAQVLLTLRACRPGRQLLHSGNARYRAIDCHVVMSIQPSTSPGCPDRHGVPTALRRSTQTQSAKGRCPDNA
jgi:hypothetical protein